jgi:hypothetical protein
LKNEIFRIGVGRPQVEFVPANRELGSYYVGRLPFQEPFQSEAQHHLKRYSAGDCITNRIAQLWLVNYVDETDLESGKANQ